VRSDQLQPRGIALLTGGQGDLAQACAESLQAVGYTVLCPGRHELDVCSQQSVDAYFASLEQLDLLVGCAGILQDQLLPRLSEANWVDLNEVHLKGAFRCAQAALKLMSRQRSGHLLFISSRSALHGPVGQTAYAAAKAGLIGLAKSLALEYGKRGIRANVLLPGFLDTKLTRDLLSKRMQPILEEHVLGTLSSLEDAARTVVFLDSLKAVSGQVIQLDNRVGRWS